MPRKFAYLSDQFVEAVRRSEHRGYVLAHLHRLTASQLSLYIKRRRSARVDDQRVLSLAAMLGVRPDEVFEPTPAPSAPLPGTGAAA